MKGSEVYYNETEAALELKLDRKTLRNARKTGSLLGKPALPYYVVSKNTIRYRAIDIDVWLSDHWSL